ncbi:hypothetical protein KJ865_04830, partial [Myxococcota bacterium]|nr:hypothetical protein [Myxococcota bacterium]
MPSFGFTGAVGLFLDTNGDGSMETAVDITSATTSDDMDESEFGDIYSVRIYPREEFPSLAPFAPRINALSPEILDTRVFINSAWVIPLPLDALGITKDSSAFGIQAWAMNEDLSATAGPAVYFSPADLPFNTTDHGIEHTPFTSDQSITITRYSGKQIASADPKLLLIHHTNAHSRHEVLDLSPDALEQELMSMELSPSNALLTAQETISATLLLTNLADYAVKGGEAQLTISGTGLRILAFNGPAGRFSCSSSWSEGICEFGRIDAQEEVAISVLLQGVVPGEATLSGEVHSGLSCNAPRDINFLSGTYVIEPAADNEPSPGDPSGCGCRSPARDHQQSPLLLLAVLVLLWVRTRFS